MENSTYKLIDNVSDVYSHLLPDFFKQSFLHENLATCDQCILLTDDNEIYAPEVQGSVHEYCIFHPDVKCCTYEPDLPNFLVGAILSSNGSELTIGQKRITQKILQGKGVTPQDIQATKSSSLEYNQLIDQSSECNRDIGCPYFDKSNRNCSIWMFRQANCSTFFCKSVEGIAGQQFWEAMNYYLSGIEKELARFAAQSIELSPESELWNRDKPNYYITAYRTIKKSKSADFQKFCNSSLINLLEQVKKRYFDATRTTVPVELKKNPSLEYQELPNSIYEYDTGHGRCHLSKRLHSILHYFDGSTDNEQVVELIAAEKNISIPTSMLLRLYKNRILTSTAGTD
jgi:Fe-S-cluster containining protein